MFCHSCIYDTTHASENIVNMGIRKNTVRTVTNNQQESLKKKRTKEGKSIIIEKNLKYCSLPKKNYIK